MCCSDDGAAPAATCDLPWRLTRSSLGGGPSPKRALPSSETVRDSPVRAKLLRPSMPTNPDSCTPPTADHHRRPPEAIDTAAATLRVVCASAARRVTTRGRRGTILSAGLPVRPRATSSSGRAPQWHCGGAGFESPVVHPSPVVLVQCVAVRSTLDAGPTSFKPNRGRVGAGDHCGRHPLHRLHLVSCRRAPGLAEHALPALLAAS